MVLVEMRRRGEIFPIYTVGDDLITTGDTEELMVEGRNVFVTGAGNELGLTIARRFVGLGAESTFG